MPKQKKKPSKAQLEKVIKELSEIAIEKKKLTDRESELRWLLADTYHTGEDGTENIEVHGYEVKVTRKLMLSITKGALEELEEDNPELFKEVTKKETVTKLVTGSAKDKLDDLEDYVTTKQGLPAIKFKVIE